MKDLISDKQSPLGNNQPTSILQGWVTELGLRFQGVLLTVIRGCDMWSKYSLEKALIREMRGLILVPFDPRELEMRLGFMTGFPNPDAKEGFEMVLIQIDPLPVHYVMHLLHGIEILGHCHPSDEVRHTYLQRYYTLCDKFHLYPESKLQLIHRLNEDRIAKGTVEQ